MATKLVSEATGEAARSGSREHRRSLPLPLLLVVRMVLGAGQGTFLSCLSPFLGDGSFGTELFTDPCGQGGANAEVATCLLACIQGDV
eukprot:15470164-Alexandrium_andersonii.AAC.2